MLLGEIKDDTYTIQGDQKEADQEIRELVKRLDEERASYHQLSAIFWDLIETILDRVNIRP